MTTPLEIEMEIPVKVTTTKIQVLVETTTLNGSLLMMLAAFAEEELTTQRVSFPMKLHPFVRVITLFLIHSVMTALGISPTQVDVETTILLISQPHQPAALAEEELLMVFQSIQLAQMVLDASTMIPQVIPSEIHAPFGTTPIHLVVETSILILSLPSINAAHVEEDCSELMPKPSPQLLALLITLHQILLVTVALGTIPMPEPNAKVPGMMMTSAPSINAALAEEESLKSGD